MIDREKKLARDRKSTKRKREKWRASGLCPRCGRRLEGRKECPKCLNAGRIRAARNRERQYKHRIENRLCTRCSSKLVESDEGFKTCIWCRERQLRGIARRTIANYFYGNAGEA